jgi:hypothetical protein
MRRRRSSRSEGVSAESEGKSESEGESAGALERAATGAATGTAWGAGLNIGEAPNDPVERRASLFRRDIADTIHRFSAACKASPGGQSATPPLNLAWASRWLTVLRAVSCALRIVAHRIARRRERRERGPVQGIPGVDPRRRGCEPETSRQRDARPHDDRADGEGGADSAHLAVPAEFEGLRVLGEGYARGVRRGARALGDLLLARRGAARRRWSARLIEKLKQEARQFQKYDEALIF